MVIGNYKQVRSELLEEILGLHGVIEQVQKLQINSSQPFFRFQLGSYILCLIYRIHWIYNYCPNFIIVLNNSGPELHLIPVKFC